MTTIPKTAPSEPGDEAMQAAWDVWGEQLESEFGPMPYAVVVVVARSFQEGWDAATRRAKPATRRTPPKE